jgi:hypothetical protein
MLRADIPATDVQVILDALDGEPLSLAEAIGDEELRRRIRGGTLSVDLATDTPFDLGHDVEVLSTYLAAPVVATEIAIGDRVIAERIVGRGGETVRVPLDTVWSDGELEIMGENEEALERALPTMPRWAQSLLAS